MLHVGDIVHVHVGDGTCLAAIATETHPGDRAYLTVFTRNGPRSDLRLYEPGSAEHVAAGLWHRPDHQ